MNFKKATFIISVLAVVLLLGYDAVAILKEGTEASISSLIITVSYNQPLVPFMVGFLCGHLFWRMKGNAETAKLNLDIKK